MGKKLAIRGHSTRGEEVIEILEMMGGKNNCDCPGDNLGLCYLIDDEFDICAHYFGYDDYEDGELNIFTLEEFLEKYPFKVGDKVEVCGTDKVFTIGNMMWEDELCTVHYANMEDFEYYTANELKPYKETNMNESKFGTVKKPLKPKSNAVKLVDDKVVDNLDKGETMNKKLAFWGDCNGYGYKIIRILEELGGINVSNYGGTEVTSLYYIDKKNHIKGVYNGDLDKEKYVIMTYHDFIVKYPFQVGDIVYAVDNHEEGKIVEIIWRETTGQMMYLVDFENTTSWVFVDDIFSYEPIDNSERGTANKPMKGKSNTVKFVDNKVVDNLDEVKTMNMKLAIKSHVSRGKEIIELFKMLGGRECGYSGGGIGFYYYISQFGNIEGSCEPYEFNTYIVYTLEEFLEKYPFKIGDKVFLYDNITEGCVTGMKWDEIKGTVKYCVYTSVECWCDVKELLKWNAIDLVERHYEEQCEEMTKDITLKHLYELGMENMKKEIVTRMDIEDASFILNYMILPNKVDDELEYKFPDGYEFDKVENGKIILKPIKTEYPKTYKECCDVLLIPPYYNLRYHTYEPCYDEYATSNTLLSLENKLNTLGKLLICRNAYWKILGEEMGLSKPWEPDFGKETNYCISYYMYNKNYQFYRGNCNNSNNRILAFPTEDIGDTFYENFKDLIEQCKEFL